MYWSVGWCCGSTGPMTDEISVLALQCPCCIVDAVMHLVGAFIPFWKRQKRFRLIFFKVTLFSEHFNNN